MSMSSNRGAPRRTLFRTIINPTRYQVLVRKIDPFRGGPHPGNWSNSSNAKLLKAINLYRQQRLEVQRLYAEVFPNDPEYHDSESDEPHELAPRPRPREHRHVCVVCLRKNQDGDTTSEDEGNEAEGDEAEDDEAEAEDDEAKSPVSDDEDPNVFGSLVYNPGFRNYKPPGSEYQFYDPTTNPNHFPVICQDQWEVPFPGERFLPGQHIPIVVLNPTWHLDVQQWFRKPSRQHPPLWYPYSKSLYLAAIDVRLLNCPFLHIVINPDHDLSSFLVDLPCGCLRAVWLSMAWVFFYYPFLHDRILSDHQRQRNKRSNPFMPHCYVVGLPQSYSESDQTAVEVWPLRSRYKVPPQVTTRKRRRSSGANFTPARDLESRRAQRLRRSWYKDAVQL
jgi:hypothetical protein